MYRTILVGIDQREQSRDALALGRLIAERTGAQLVGVCVYASRAMGNPRWEEEARQLADRTARDALEGGPGGEQAATIASTSPARGLHEAAEHFGAGLIVVGSAHRGKIGRLMAGSTASGLLAGAPCAVAVAPAGYAGRADAKLDTIGVAYDGRPESVRALTSAIDLAQSVGSRLCLITLVYPPDRVFAPDPFGHEDVDELLEKLKGKMEAVQEEAAASIPEGLEYERRVYSDPNVALAHVEGVDLMLMGSRNYGPLKRVFIGSLAQSVMTTAPWPVIVLPRGDEAASLEDDAATGAAVGEAR